MKSILLFPLILSACLPKANQIGPTSVIKETSILVGTMTATPTITATPIPSPIAGNIVYARTCEALDVQSSLNAAKDGQIVSVPAGVCDWGASATVKRKSGIWLKGAGVGKTVIKRSGPVVTLSNGNPPPHSFLLEFDCGNQKGVELSGISFIGNDLLQSEDERLVDVDNGVSLKNHCQNFKIHENEFKYFSQSGLTVSGHSKGVIYNNQFVSNFKCQKNPVSCLGYGLAVYGDGVWDGRSLASLAGTDDFVFIEDNIFEDNRHSVASNNASKYVVRFNRIATSERARNFGIIDAHGKGSSPRGSRVWEIYRNTLVDLSSTQNNTTSISLRGGDGLLWENTVPKTFAWIFALSTESPCNTSNYPLQDQSREVYFWDNKFQTPTLSWKAYSPECTKLGREIYEAKPFWYTPYLYPHPLRSQQSF